MISFLLSETFPAQLINHCPSLVLSEHAILNFLFDARVFQCGLTVSSKPGEKNQQFAKTIM